MRDGESLFRALIGDGRPLIGLVALGLILSGGFALFLGATGHLLPHDSAYLGLTAAELCQLAGCRILGFMIHDRVAFGGALIAVGVLYLWLAEFPLPAGEAWAWWVLALSGGAGFASFLAYLGYGYLDTWHGVATLALLPLFVAGLGLTRRRLAAPGLRRALWRPPAAVRQPLAYRLGWTALLLAALGLAGAGSVILTIGTVRVFVPQDLRFIGLTVPELHALNPRLVPLIAHDRVGFGGALLATGLAVLGCVWYGRPSRNWWQALALAGAAGFGCAIGIHFVVGYVDFTHLAPAYLGAATFVLGMGLTHRACVALPAGPGGRRPRLTGVAASAQPEPPEAG